MTTIFEFCFVQPPGTPFLMYTMSVLADLFPDFKCSYTENETPARIPIADPKGGANELPAIKAPINPIAAIIVKTTILSPRVVLPLVIPFRSAEHQSTHPPGLNH